MLVLVSRSPLPTAPSCEDGNVALVCLRAVHALKPLVKARGHHLLQSFWIHGGGRRRIFPIDCLPLAILTTVIHLSVPCMPVLTSCSLCGAGCNTAVEGFRALSTHLVPKHQLYRLLQHEFSRTARLAWISTPACKFDCALSLQDLRHPLALILIHADIGF